MTEHEETVDQRHAPPEGGGGEGAGWERQEGSGTGGQGLKELVALPSKFPAYLLSPRTAEPAAVFPPPQPADGEQERREERDVKRREEGEGERREERDEKRRVERKRRAESGPDWQGAFNVTTVLCPWHRPALLQVQLRALREQTFPISQVKALGRL